MASFILANFLATLHFVFYVEEGLRTSYRYGTTYNVARKLAKRNGAIIYAEAGTFGLGYLLFGPDRMEFDGILVRSTCYKAGKNNVKILTAFEIRSWR